MQQQLENGEQGKRALQRYSEVEKKLLDFILKYFSEFDSKLDDINTRCKQGIQVFFRNKISDIYISEIDIFEKM